MKRRRSKAKPIPGPVVVELQTPCGMPIGMKVYVAEDGTILDRPTTVAAEPADPGRARPSEQPLCGDVAVIRPADGFDYESIADASVASDMRSAAERIRQRTRAAYIETGRELSAIKTRLEHGSFVAWVERECEINIRTAQRRMAVVEFLAKNDRLSYLPPSTLSLLTARLTPVEAVDALSGRIDAGERPSTEQVSALIAKAHEEKKELGRQWQQECKRREERERRVGRQLSDEEHRQADQQRAKRLERETKKLEETEAQRRASTRAAARMLAEHLKDRLDEFIELVKDLGWWDIQFSLSELRDARGLQPRSTGRDERT